MQRQCILTNDGECRYAGEGIQKPVQSKKSAERRSIAMRVVKSSNFKPE